MCAVHSACLYVDIKVRHLSAQLYLNHDSKLKIIIKIIIKTKWPRLVSVLIGLLKTLGLLCWE